MKKLQKQRMLVSAVTLVAVVTLALSATSATAALLYTNPQPSSLAVPDSGLAGYTLGLAFQVGSTPIRVTGLGVWEQGSGNLNAAHQVGLYDASGTLLAHTTVGVSDPWTADGAGAGNGFRFNTSLTIDSGTGILAANSVFYLGDLLTATADQYLDGNFGAHATFASSVTDLGAYYGGGSGVLSWPNNFNGLGAPVAFIGPNMEFDLLVPEPSSLVLITLGGLLLWRRVRQTL